MSLKKLVKIARKRTKQIWKQLKKLFWVLVNKEIRTWKKANQEVRQYLLISRSVFALVILMFLARGEYVYYRCDLPVTVYDTQTQQSWPNVFRWCGLITDVSAKHGFDPSLIAAIIWVESRGDPSAISVSGASGLMQVMPRDGKASAFWCRYGPCFADRPTLRELQNPTFNVGYGTGLLKTNLVYYGNLRDALKAYGPANYGYRYADLVLDTARKIEESM